MRINFLGRLVDEPEIRAGFIGCGSHSFRNIYPTFQFAPVNLVATCDVELEKAEAFAHKFGAENAYADYREMLEQETLDAVFIVTGYDERGRPRHANIGAECVEASCHVWMEKPPAATLEELHTLHAAATHRGKNVMVGFKKMFFPANEKARELSEQDDFGTVSMIRLEYPVAIPTVDAFQTYLAGEKRVREVVGFLDHLCHPAAVLLLLGGMPDQLYYQRAANGAGVSIFTYGDGKVATLAHTHGNAGRDGMERTVIISDSDRHIVVENNIEVRYHRTPRIGYGDVPDYFVTELEQTTAVWKPEFSLGQLYNKGLFLLGYYNEVNEFARSILEKRTLAKGTIADAIDLTRLFLAYAEGPGKSISLAA